MVVGKQITQTVVYVKLEYIYMYNRKRKKKKEEWWVGENRRNASGLPPKSRPQRIYRSVGWKPRVRHDAMKNSNRVSRRMASHGRS